jgi:hypothetical protein
MMKLAMILVWRRKQAATGRQIMKQTMNLWCSYER